MWKSTEQNKKYWEHRQIDWGPAYFTPDHPHRSLIIEALAKKRFGSVYEVGCGAGANLYRILQAYPRTRIGGIDVNPNAIEEAHKHLPRNALLEVRSIEDIFMNDKSIDVLISDACLIYVDPFKINKVVKEIGRVTRSHVVFVELHSSDFFERWKIRSKGYHAYDYKKLLRKHDFYDIEVTKIPKGVWDGTPWENWGHVITARI